MVYVSNFRELASHVATYLIVPTVFLAKLRYIGLVEPVSVH